MQLLATMMEDTGAEENGSLGWRALRDLFGGLRQQLPQAKANCQQLMRRYSYDHTGFTASQETSDTTESRPRRVTSMSALSSSAPRGENGGSSVERQGLSQRRYKLPPAMPPSYIQSDDDGISNASVVSEVTLMTYSDENAESLKQEFVRRVALQKKDLKNISVSERNVILHDILMEQHSKAWRTRRRDAEERGCDQNEDDQDQDDEEDENVGRDCDFRRSLESSKTIKHGNVIREQDKHDTSNSEWGHLDLAGPDSNILSSSLVNHGPAHNITSAIDVSERTWSEASESQIEQIIELKLLVAEQQATIDTLSSQDCHRKQQMSKQREAISALTAQLNKLEVTRRKETRRISDENEQLRNELKECREREKSLMHQINEGRAAEAGFTLSSSYRQKLIAITDNPEIEWA